MFSQHGKRNGETNTFPWSDWPGDGSLQYRGNTHIQNKNQDTITKQKLRN